LIVAAAAVRWRTRAATKPVQQTCPRFFVARRRKSWRPRSPNGSGSAASAFGRSVRNAESVAPDH